MFVTLDSESSRIDSIIVLIIKHKYILIVVIKKHYDIDIDVFKQQ